MRLGNLKIGVRLGSCFGLVILMTILVGILGINEMKKLSTLTTKLHKHPYTVSTAMLRIEGNIIKIHRSMKDVALAKDSAQIKTAVATVEQFEQAVYKDFDIVNERFLGDKKQVNAAVELFVNWKPIRDEVIELMIAGNRDQAAAITKGKGAAHVQKLDTVVDEFIQFANGKADEFVKNAASARDRALFITYLILGISIVAAIALALIMTRSITGPMQEAVHVADRLAENDLTVTIDSNRKDETGQLLHAMKKMVDNLSDTISANAAASEALSSGASQQASAIEETSSSMEEMAAMTKQNAANATEADSLTKEANQVMAKANDSMAALKNSMEDISKASDETSKIIKTIDEIAFQTNLLALNAAVEAARAGEAGAGFAVVADEVRNLAMRAADAARNTSDLIEGTVKKVGDGSELVVQTNDAFSEVATGTQKVGELVAEIAAASKEQSQGIEQVNTAMAEMDKVTQANAAGAEEMAASMAVFRTNYVHNPESVKRSSKFDRSSNEPDMDLAALPQSTTAHPGQVIPMDGDEFKDF